MRLFDLLRNAGKAMQEKEALNQYQKRLQSFVGRERPLRRQICTDAITQAFSGVGESPSEPVQQAAYQLCESLLAFDQHLYLPQIESQGGAYHC